MSSCLSYIRRPKISAVLLLVLATLACHGDKRTEATDELVGRPATAGRQRANLWYRIELRDDRLLVAVRLFAPPSRTRFFLPGDWAGRDDFADVIGIAGAATEAGPADMAIDRTAGEIEIVSENAAWVQLEYNVELTAKSAFHAQLDRGVLVAFALTFLVTPSQQVLSQTSEIPIELSVPAQFDVVSTWPGRGSAASSIDSDQKVHQFLAADVGELRDAFVVAGSDLRMSRTGADESLVEIAFAPVFEGDTSGFATLVTAVAAGFRRTYGPAGPVHAFVRTRTSRVNEFGGVGRRGGFILDVPPDTEVSDATRLLVAHEALHVWNGHLLLPADNAERETRWFKEGVTHYLALKSLDGLDEAFVLEELARAGSNYARNPISGGAKGDEMDRTRFPYDKGVLIAFALDAVLTEASKSGTGLECWLATLLRSDGHAYDQEGLFAALQQCAGPGGGRRVAELWRHWVREGERIDVRGLFADVGLHYLPATQSRDARLVPLDGAAPVFRQIFGFEAP